MPSTRRWADGRSSRLDFWRSEWLGHYQQMAGNQSVHFFGKRHGAVFHVAEFPIKGREFCPQIDHAKIHEAAAGGAAMILRGFHQLPAASSALQRRLYGSQTEIGAVPTRFNVHAAG